MAKPNQRGLLLYLSLFIFYGSNYCTATCYTPNGLDRNAQFNATFEYEYYAPCNNAANVSMCCGIGPGRGGSMDTCLPSGLCNNTGSNVYWRESCTDPTWNDPACVKLFVNGTNSYTDDPLTKCDDGSWCDSFVSTSKDCCAGGQGFFLVNGKQTRQNPNATSSATQSSTTSSATQGTTSTTAQAGSGGLSSGAKAGIGVGVGVGVVAVLGLLIGYIMWQRSKKSRRQTGQLDGERKHFETEKLSPDDVYQMPTPQTKTAVPRTDDVYEMSTPQTKTAGPRTNDLYEMSTTNKPAAPRNLVELAS